MNKATHVQTPNGSGELESARAVVDRLRNRLRAVIVGRNDVIDLVVIALLADGHVLLEDYPGSGKTTLARCLGESIESAAERAEVAAFVGGIPTIDVVDPRLRDPFNLEHPDFRPNPNSPAVDGTLPFAVAPNDGFFEVALYRGPLGPASEDDWTTGWPNFAPH